MRTIITGLNGTVAPVVARLLKGYGHSVVDWDRSVVPIDNEGTIFKFLEDHNPDWFLHIATGSPDWAELIAKICAQKKIKLLYTSSASVFSSSQKGPFRISAIPQPEDDYGRYKLLCEKLIKKNQPDAIIARLAWQIGDEPGSNNMIDYLHKQLEQKGRIEASSLWFPACAFLRDTAEALYQLMVNFPAGIYHLDGNPGLSFYEIVSQLNKLYGEKWPVLQADLPVMNNCLLDDHLLVKSIMNRFQA
jgi:dTDP-4-dehydrorhamnose reductase